MFYVLPATDVMQRTVHLELFHSELLTGMGSSDRPETDLSALLM